MPMELESTTFIVVNRFFHFCPLPNLKGTIMLKPRTKQNVIVGLAVAIILTVFAGCGDPKAVSNEPVKAGATVSHSAAAPKSFAGSWINDEKTMAATVTDDTIEIFITAPDSKSLYWSGTIPTSETEKFVSKADTEKLASSMLGSTDASKTFQYDDGELSFELSMMGTTQTIRLTKE